MADIGMRTLQLNQVGKGEDIFFSSVCAIEICITSKKEDVNKLLKE